LQRNKVAFGVTELIPLRQAALDPGLSARLVRRVPLLYASGPDAVSDRPAHVRAGSSLAWVGGRLALIQDDANFLALVSPDSAAVESVTLPAGKGGLRQFDDLRGNKKHKLDLEACVAIEEQGRPVFLAFGSGSTERREKVLVARHLDRAGPSITLLELPSLYRLLRGTPGFAPGRLNIEGVVRVGDLLRFFSRGNGKERGGVPPVNATCDLPLEEFLAHCEMPERFPPPTPVQVVQYDLGALGGVPLGFTDAAVVGDAVVYSVAAEASPDAVDDGVVSGSALGIIEASGRTRWAPITDAQGAQFVGKVEGLVAAEVPGSFYVVLDADDPTVPSELCVVELDGI